MKLSELMKEKRFKAKDIADACGVTPSAVSHWKKGMCMPSLENLKKIAQLMEVTIDELIGASK